MLLQGGLRLGHVTELVGPSSSGKTQVRIKSTCLTYICLPILLVFYTEYYKMAQICFQVASNVAMKLGSAVFLDSGNSFSPTRIKQIVARISGSVENHVSSFTFVLLS